jgi:hypothetical protein
VPQTFITIDPMTGRRGLLIEAHPEAPEGDGPAHALARELCRRLFDRSIRVGIVVTRSTTVVVRDLVTQTSFAQNRFRFDSVPTPNLFAHAQLGAPLAGAAAFCEQVRTWLEAVGSSWYSFLWPDAAPAMVPDVVGHLAQALLATHEGLLQRGDAA